MLRAVEGNNLGDADLLAKRTAISGD